MKEFQSAENSDGKTNGIFYRQWSIVLEQRLERTIRRIFTDDYNLAVVVIRLDQRQNVGMPARLHPQFCLLFDSSGIDYVFNRQLERNLRGRKATAPFSEPNFTKPAAPDALNEGVNSDLLILLEHEVS